MSLLKQKISSVMLMKPHEQKAALAAFVMVFILMATYFTLRPIRDAMASDWSDSEVSFLWNIQFFMSIGLVSIYSFAVSRMRLKYVVPVVYASFSVSFFLFYALSSLWDQQILLEKTFYLWVTAFSLLNLSMFWSFMSHIFSQKQGKRLFPFIGAGASAGAILGPAIPVLFVKTMGLDNLMLLAAIGLMLAVPLIVYLNRQKNQVLTDDQVAINNDDQAVGGKWWSGFKDVFSSRYLIAIAVFILLYVFINSFIYFQQKNILADFSRADRAQILGGIDWVVNLLTFVFAFTITGRMVKYWGMGLTLASMPLLLIFGFITLFFAPTVTILLAIQVVRRVGNYSISRPAREMLFTQVNTDQRFKAKPVIDVVIYRGGDAVSASLFALLTDGFGLGLAAMSVIGTGIASLWAGVGINLGRQYKALKPEASQSSNQHNPDQFTQINQSNFNQKEVI